LNQHGEGDFVPPGGKALQERGVGKRPGRLWIKELAQLLNQQQVEPGQN